jgi:hypothetical protein
MTRSLFEREKTFKCWYNEKEGDEDDDPVDITARSAEEAASRFVERDWEGEAEWYFVGVRDGQDVSRWRVTVEVTTEFTARRVKNT